MTDISEKTPPIPVVEESRTDGSELDQPVSSIEDPEDHVPHLHAKTFLVVFAVCLIYFVQVVNVVGAGARAEDISAVLGGSANSVWITSVITILTVVLSPPVSEAADYWGRRWFLIGLTTCGAIGSIIVARATSMNMAIAGEVVAGISYGAQPLLVAVCSEVLPRRYRPYGQAAANVAAASGGLVGLLTGGAMTRHDNHAGFRNFWYMTFALYAIAAMLCAALYNPPTRPSQIGLTNMEKLKKLDWIGYLLLASGLVLFCVGLSWSQNPYNWTNAHILAPFLIGCALIFGLGIYEWKFKTDGMFHHGLFSNGMNFPIALGCVFVEGLSFFAANNYFAFEVSVLYETDPLIVGVRYGITFICYILSSILAGVFCSKTKLIRYPSVFAFLLLTLFFVLMATATPYSSNAVWGYAVILGFGLGTVLTGLFSIAQLSTPKELIATTSGLMIGVRSLGGSVGLAVYNAIFTAKLTSNIGPKIAEAVLPLGLPTSSLPQFISGLTSENNTLVGITPGVTPQIIKAGLGGLFEAYSQGFRYVWISAGVFVFVSAIAAAFLVDSPKEFNMRIDAPAEEEKDLFNNK